MDQVIQIVGAVLILVAFGALQRDALSPHSLAYLMLNFVGAAVLAAVAFVDSDWGFFLLEGVWTLVSLWGLAELARRRQAAQ
jgi:membrane-bound ClpP family serine protease